MKIFVGAKKSGDWKVFKSPVVPDERTHGKVFAFAIGPFKTVRGARFMAQFGRDNPHCLTVADAERLGRRLE